MQLDSCLLLHELHGSIKIEKFKNIIYLDKCVPLETTPTQIIDSGVKGEEKNSNLRFLILIFRFFFPYARFFQLPRARIHLARIAIKILDKERLPRFYNVNLSELSTKRSIKWCVLLTQCFLPRDMNE